MTEAMGVPEAVRAAAQARGYRELRPLGDGPEFAVYEAIDADDVRVVVRTSTAGRFSCDANDDTSSRGRALLEWEHAVTRHVAAEGIPVAQPRELVSGEPELLVTEYLPDDGAGVEPAALGGLLRRLHDVSPPPVAPVAAEGLPAGRVLVERMLRRWHALDAVVAELPEPPDAARMAATLAGSAHRMSLVHLDVRAANLRCVGGEVRGIVGWCNALVADPALELGRLAELARLPESGIDFAGVLGAYGDVGAADDALWLYRLDAAVMLAVASNVDTQDERRGPASVDRLREVHARLMHAWTAAR